MIVPELPEVETICRGLAPAIVGEKILCVEQNRADLRFPFPENFTERLQGQRVKQLQRRAKYLLANLSGGETLILHLGMSGRMTLLNETPQKRKSGRARAAANVKSPMPGRHDHVVFHMSKNKRLVYNDPRRFGFMLLAPTEEISSHPLFAKLGPEPLGNAFSANYFANKALGRRSDVKSFLMDQRVVAGLGNIYVCEALHRARISPFRRTSTLAKKSGSPTSRAERLVRAIREVLNEAIESGGSSLRDYRQANGAMGYFQHTFKVYDQLDEPCQTPDCTGIVKRKVSAGRSTFYCSKCQV